MEWYTNRLESGITHSFKIGDIILDIGMCRESIGDIVFLPSRWEGKNISSKIKLRIFNALHGVELLKVFNQGFMILGEAHYIIHIPSYIFIAAILEPIDPEVRVRLRGSKIDMAKLGRKRLMETCSSTACTIDRLDKDHALAFKIWSKFCNSNNEELFIGIAGKESIINVTRDTFQIVHLGNNKSHEDGFNRVNWRKTIFLVNRR